MTGVQRTGCNCWSATKEKLDAFFRHPVVDKICKVVTIIFMSLVTLALLTYSPILTSSCIILGIFFKRQVQEGVQHLKDVAKGPFAIVLVVAVVAYFALPVVAATTPTWLSVIGISLWSANVGKNIHYAATFQKAQDPTVPQRA